MAVDDEKKKTVIVNWLRFSIVKNWKKYMVIEIEMQMNGFGINMGKLDVLNKSNGRIYIFYRDFERFWEAVGKIDKNCSWILLYIIFKFK